MRKKRYLSNIVITVIIIIIIIIIINTNYKFQDAKNFTYLNCIAL